MVEVASFALVGRATGGLSTRPNAAVPSVATRCRTRLDPADGRLKPESGKSSFWDRHPK